MKDYQMQLVTDYMGFADEVATKIGSMALQTRDEMCVTLDDLKQESWLGLYEAAKNYDKALGIDFKLLAYMWCRKHVVDALSQYSAPLSGPEKGKRGIDILHFDVLGRDLGDDEDGSPADYLFYQLALMAEAEERAAEADEKAKRRVKRRVKRALRGLTQREREVICHLFGLGGKPLTRNETASLMGVTNERIRILQEKALNRLELYLAA